MAGVVAGDDPGARLVPTYLFACCWFVLFTVVGWIMARLARGGICYLG
jgi:hypothetical protein